MVNHLVDLNRKIGSAEFNLVQLRLGRQEALESALSLFLKDFQPDDYLLLIGDPSCIAIACSIATTKTKGIVKVLKWDKREHTYIPINIDLEL